MNLIQFWQDQVNLWDESAKCGLCWSFNAPLTESAVNLVQTPPEDICCVQVFLTRDKVTPFNTQNSYNQRTGLLTNVTCNTSFQLLFLIEMDMGTNNYAEIPGYPVSEGKWFKLARLEDCISCDMNLNFCELIGSQYRVTQWTAQQVINYADKNYSGYRLTVNFQTIR